MEVDRMPRSKRNVSESKAVISRVMMPQDANMSGNVFGGTILKMVDEISFVSATRHARTNVVTASLDKMDFHSPVHIGDLVTLYSIVNAAWRSSMEVGVKVTAENVRTGEIRHTGSSYLTVVALDGNGKPTEVPELILETDEDARRNAEANERRKRRLEDATSQDASRWNT
jgi:acyl-CoA hydrolase